MKKQTSVPKAVYQPPQPPESGGRKYIRFPKVQNMVGDVSRSTLWRWIRDGYFPKSYPIGPNVCVWDEAEVLAWMDSKKGGNN